MLSSRILVGKMSLGSFYFAGTFVASSILKRSRHEPFCYNCSKFFVNRFFEDAPLSLKLMFPFASMGDAMYDSPEFAEAARQAANSLDGLVGCLGSDVDISVTQMMELVEDKRKLSRLRREHWKLLKDVLLQSLTKILGESRLSKEESACWESCYETLSNHLLEQMRQEKAAARLKAGQGKK